MALVRPTLARLTCHPSLFVSYCSFSPCWRQWMRKFGYLNDLTSEVLGLIRHGIASRINEDVGWNTLLPTSIRCKHKGAVYHFHASTYLIQDIWPWKSRAKRIDKESAETSFSKFVSESESSCYFVYTVKQWYHFLRRNAKRAIS